MDLSFISVVLHILILVAFIFVIYLVTNKLDTAISITIIGLLVHFIFVYLSFFPI
jgi:hypothetical protein